jgi:type IX secretion system substrate protein
MNFIITDENGKTVLAKNITGKEEIDVSRLNSGVYYLKNTSTGAAQKIVIIK